MPAAASGRPSNVGRGSDMTWHYALPTEATGWTVPGVAEARFDWRYDEGRGRLLALYERGKAKQWNARERIDWSIDVWSTRPNWTTATPTTWSACSTAFTTWPGPSKCSRLAAARGLRTAPWWSWSPIAAHAFAAPAGDVERFLYAVSVLHCLPVGLSDQPSAATGTVIRPRMVRAYARQAGFANAEILPLQHAFHRLYLLRDVLSQSDADGR